MPRRFNALTGSVGSIGGVVVECSTGTPELSTFYPRRPPPGPIKVNGLYPGTRSIKVYAQVTATSRRTSLMFHTSNRGRMYTEGCADRRQPNRSTIVGRDNEIGVPGQS